MTDLSPPFCPSCGALLPQRPLPSATPAAPVTYQGTKRPYLEDIQEWSVLRGVWVLSFLFVFGALFEWEGLHSPWTWSDWMNGPGQTVLGLVFLFGFVVFSANYLGFFRHVKKETT